VSVLILLLLLFDFIVLRQSGPKHESTVEEIFLLSSEGTGYLEILALLPIVCLLTCELEISRVM